MGLAGQVAFSQGSAQDLPFAGVRRVLRAGGTFAIYDVMRVGSGDPGFPVPWASRPDTSFLASPTESRAALASAGFVLVAERRWAGFALDFFQAMQARMAAGGHPALGLHIVMGAAAGQKTANMVRATAAGLIEPTEMIARAV